MYKKVEHYVKYLFTIYKKCVIMKNTLKILTSRGEIT